MAYYSLALCLDINMPACITARNKATQDRYGGYQIDYAALQLPTDIAETLTAMRAEYGRLFDFEEDRYPTVEQETEFRARLEALVPKLQAALGPDYAFEVE